MVVVELLKTRLHAGRMPNCYFYRDARGHEVDLLLRQQRKMRPVEIKAALTFSSDMTKGLSHYRKRFPDSLPGAVIYGGDIETESDVLQLISFPNAHVLQQTE